MTAQSVLISEVGLRDGLQIERTIIPTERKRELLDAILAAGVTRIEVTGFVHPKIMPQMADADEIARGLPRRDGVRYGAFIPNAKGAARAIAAGIDDLKCGAATSDSFNELNVRMPRVAAMQAIRDCAVLASGTKAQIVGTIGTAFGCPYEGSVPGANLYGLVDLLVELGAPVIYLADTSGMADPVCIGRTLDDLHSRYPRFRFGLHLHNTRGVGMANALAGLERGVVDFEGSVAGLGGCPFAPRAAGNISTEDFVHMCEAMGLETGIDLDALILAAQLAEEIVGRTLPGMVMKAGKASQRFEKGASAVKLD